MQIYQAMHINHLMMKLFKNNAKIFFKNKFLWCSVLCICRDENITEVCVQQDLNNAFRPSETIRGQPCCALREMSLCTLEWTIH